MYKPFVENMLKIYPKAKFLYNKWEKTKFNKNDIIIHVGVLDNKIINFIKKTELYTILYWTEPVRFNQNLSKYFDEILLYSKLIFNLHEKSYFSQKIKFIPILNQDNSTFINYLNKKDDIKLCFLGNLDYRSDEVKKLFLDKEYFIHKYDLFTDNAYNFYLQNNCHIF